MRKVKFTQETISERLGAIIGDFPRLDVSLVTRVTRPTRMMEVMRCRIDSLERQRSERRVMLLLLCALVETRADVLLPVSSA